MSIKRLFSVAIFLIFIISCGGDDPWIDFDNTGGSDEDHKSDIDPTKEINIPDPVLRKCIEGLVMKQPGEPVFAGDVAGKTRLDCDDVSDLTGVEYFVDATSFEFDDSKISSLDPMKNLVKIESIVIFGGGFITLDALKNMSKLKSVAFSSSDLKDISGIDFKQYLESLSLRNNKIENASALSNLPVVEQIEIHDNPTLTTLGGVQFNTPKLRTLNVSDCGLTSIDELSGQPELQSISVSGNYLTDVDVILTLPNLNGIGIGGNCLDDTALQTYIDWLHKRYPDSDRTVEDEKKYQDYEKCE